MRKLVESSRKVLGGFDQRRSLQGPEARLSAPLHRLLSKTRLCEVMRQHFGFGQRSFGEAVAQDFGHPTMQNLPPALEKIFVRRILNKRVFEAIVGVGRETLNEQYVSFCKPLQRGLQRCIVHPSEHTKKIVREAASNHRADLRHFAGRAESVKSRHKRLLQRWRDHMGVIFPTPIQQKPRHFLNEKRHATGARYYVVHYFGRQSMARRKLSHHVTSLSSIKRYQRDRAVM